MAKDGAPKPIPVVPVLVTGTHAAERRHTTDGRLGNVPVRVPTIIAVLASVPLALLAHNLWTIRRDHGIVGAGGTPGSPYKEGDFFALTVMNAAWIAFFAIILAVALAIRFRR